MNWGLIFTFICDYYWPLKYNMLLANEWSLRNWFCCVSWFIPVILTLGKLRQEDCHELEASLGCKVETISKDKKKKKVWGKMIGWLRNFGENQWHLDKERLLEHSTKRKQKKIGESVCVSKAFNFITGVLGGYWYAANEWYHGLDVCMVLRIKFRT